MKPIDSSWHRLMAGALVCAALGGQVQAEPDQPPAAAPAEEKLRGARLPDQLRGEKVLAMFWHHPDMKIPDKGPTPEFEKQFVIAKRKAHDEVVKAIQESGMDLVKEVDSKDIEVPFLGTSYSSLVLIDCKGQPPEKALRAIPHFLTAIVFQDGRYVRGLPVEVDPRGLLGTVKKGQIPARYAFYVKGGGFADIQQGKADVQRFEKMRGVLVEAELGPSAWVAKLKPAPGHTLLQVFMASGAKFQMVEP